MDRRKFWSALSGTIQVLLMVGALVAGSVIVYLMAAARMHRR